MYFYFFFFIPEESTVESKNKRKVFMLYNIASDIKEEYKKQIISLGGEVSKRPYFDSEATHLLMTYVDRNDVVLSSMAAGKYILHASYIFDSAENKKFLNENLYEFGNPKFLSKIKKCVKRETNVKSFYWWRQHLKGQKSKAFYNMKILVRGKRSDNKRLKRIIEAGGGTFLRCKSSAIHNINATYCLIDTRVVNAISDVIPLAKRGIPCLNMKFLSMYLNLKGKVNLKKYIVPELKKYYT